MARGGSASAARLRCAGTITALLERGQLGPDASDLADDVRQLGPGLPFVDVTVAVPGPGEGLDLAAEQSQPRVPCTPALFCKNNRRIAALVTVICLALLIFCLIERQVRQALAAQGHTKLEGLYDGRAAIPTARLILTALATMKIIPGSGHSPPIIPQPTSVQIRLLGLLGIDPRQLR